MPKDILSVEELIYEKLHREIIEALNPPWLSGETVVDIRERGFRFLRGGKSAYDFVIYLGEMSRNDCFLQIKEISGLEIVEVSTDFAGVRYIAYNYQSNGSMIYGRIYIARSGMVIKSIQDYWRMVNIQYQFA